MCEYKEKKLSEKQKTKSLYITIYVRVCVNDITGGSDDIKVQGHQYAVTKKIKNKGMWITKGKQDVFKTFDPFFSVLI